MIFVTLGSQKFQFNRLLIAIDKLVENSELPEDDVFAQTGYSDYVPKNYDYKNFLDRKEFAKDEAKADIVITHGGTGAIVGALKLEKRVIAVPRLAKYGEHVDNHQLQVLQEFDQSGLLCVCKDITKLADAVIYAKTTDFTKFKSNTSDFVKSIDEFIMNC